MVQKQESKEEVIDNDKEKNTEFITWFSKSGKGSASSLGKKGEGLKELYKMNLPVPLGFVVTTSAYKNFLKISGIDKKIHNFIENLNFENEEMLNNASENIKKLIKKSEFPDEIKEDIIDSYQILGANKVEIEKGSAKDILNSAIEPIFVSIRSSTNFDFNRGNSPREQDTYLNVKGNDEVLEHVRNAFASLFNPETMKRELRGGMKNFEIAVVIEKMVSSEKSGFVYSDDGTGNILIESIWGFGEGMNFKGSTPDKCVLNKSLEIVNYKVGSKTRYVKRTSSGSLKAVECSEERKNSQVLSNYEMQRLGDFAQKIAEHFDTPQRIDFAIDDAGIYLLQTEEFSVVSERNEEEVESFPEAVETQSEPFSHEVLKVEVATKTKLKLVIDSSALANDAVKSGLKKVGVLKLENAIYSSGKHPFYFLESNYISEYENLIYEEIKKVAQDFEEVTVRTSDFLSNEFSKLSGGEKFVEENPIMGLHGVRFGLLYPAILEAELRAIMRASKSFNVNILIPNIISVDEFIEVKKILKKIDFEKSCVSLVIETPAAVQLIKEFCSEGVYSIFVNVDRLIENLLSVDRENERIARIFDPMHPSFLYQIEYLIRVARRNGVKTHAFGSLLRNGEVLGYLVKKGIDFICVPAEEAHEVSKEVSNFEKEFFSGTDQEPRKYEIAKTNESYISHEKSAAENVNKDISQTNTSDDEKIEKDIELIEEEKKEYEDWELNEDSSDEVAPEEDSEGDENNLGNIKSKDVLGIF